MQAIQCCCQLWKWVIQHEQSSTGPVTVVRNYCSTYTGSSRGYYLRVAFILLKSSWLCGYYTRVASFRTNTVVGILSGLTVRMIPDTILNYVALYPGWGLTYFRQHWGWRVAVSLRILKVFRWADCFWGISHSARCIHQSGVKGRRHSTLWNWVAQSITESVDQLTDQSIDQSINQSINQ